MPRRSRPQPEADVSGLGCENCIFWVERTQTQDDSRWGECRRYPPTVVHEDDGVACVVAWTEPPHFCGEFRPRGH